MFNIKDTRCKPRLQDLVLTQVWPPCCATLSLGTHTHAPCLPREKSYMSLYFYACMYSMISWFWWQCPQPFNYCTLFKITSVTVEVQCIYVVPRDHKYLYTIHQRHALHPSESDSVINVNYMHHYSYLFFRSKLQLHRVSVVCLCLQIWLSHTSLLNWDDRRMISLFQLETGICKCHHT